MTFNNTDKIVTVWKRGRLNALYWAIKATRQKVKDNLFCTRRVKKKTIKKSTRKHTTEPPRTPEENTREHVLQLLCKEQDTKGSHGQVGDNDFLQHMFCIWIVPLRLCPSRPGACFLSQHQFYQSRNPRKWQQSFCFSLKVFFLSVELAQRHLLVVWRSSFNNDDTNESSCLCDTIISLSFHQLWLK